MNLDATILRLRAKHRRGDVDMGAVAHYLASALEEVYLAPGDIGEAKFRALLEHDRAGLTEHLK